MGVVASIEQYHVYLIELDPAEGRETQKTRPCIVVSPDEMNRWIGTVIIAPITTKSHEYPTRVPVQFQRKSGWIVLDQIRTVDKSRLIKALGKVSKETIVRIKEVSSEMLVE